jgi:TRAP-type C4-dicarboxylate transport system substrate-binding protein
MKMRGLLTLLLALATNARAEPIKLRFAAIAPDGTAWAREAHAFTREVESASGGQVTVRMYLGGIAGDDIEMGERMRRDQLDGVLSASSFCQQQSPSIAIFRIPGLITDRHEANHVLTRLMPTMREEARRHGMVLLSAALLGHDVLATRRPVESLADLKKLKLWQWDLDHAAVTYLRAMGLTIAAMPVGNAAAAYERGEIDGFVAIPSAIMAYQWFTKQLFLTRPTLGMLPGCVLMSPTAHDRLSPDQQAMLMAASAKLAMRFGETTELQDQQLLNGVFERQGIRTVPLSPGLRAELFEAARMGREQVGSKVVSAALLARVQSILADYRAENR